MCIYTPELVQGDCKAPALFDLYWRTTCGLIAVTVWATKIQHLQALNVGMCTGPLHGVSVQLQRE